MSTSTEVKPAEILMVEDNPADARLTLEALRDILAGNNLHRVCDGREAMAWLRQEDQYRDAPRPDIILLDLNMPQKDGRQTLAEIKTDTDLKRIPVVVFTTSTSENDILQVYDLNANCYVAKPADFERFARTVKSVVEFWLTVARLPE